MRNENRLSNAYLNILYPEWVNFDDYLLFEINDGIVELIDMPGIWKANAERTETNFNRAFLEKGRIITNVFKKNISGEILEYQPGTLDFEGNYYAHPIQIGKLIIDKLTEELKYDNRSWGKTHIHFKTFNENKIQTHCVYYVNAKKIYFCGPIINSINKYLLEGLDITKIKKGSFHVHTIENDWQKVIDFVENLVVKEFSQIHSRIGKDNRISSGIVLCNVQHDIYLEKLLTETTGFYRNLSGEYKRNNDSDYGYVPSQPYAEVVIEGRGIKDELLVKMARAYDSMKHQIFLLQEYPTDTDNAKR